MLDIIQHLVGGKAKDTIKHHKYRGKRLKKKSLQEKRRCNHSIILGSAGNNIYIVIVM